MKICPILLLLSCSLIPCRAENIRSQTIGAWAMQDAAKVSAPATQVASNRFSSADWYKATVPGTVLTTLVDNKVYPEPLYGENMRSIPESLNKTQYWYRTSFVVPADYKGKHVWLHFGGINYSAEIWVNGHQEGTMRGAFIRGDFDITDVVKPGSRATVAVLISPQPHPGVAHEHTVADGVGKNGGETAIDGATFLSTIGWDWLPAIRDRDTGIWLPVTMDATGPVVVKDPFITSELAPGNDFADLRLSAILRNTSDKAVSGTLVGTISGHGRDITFRKSVTIAATETKEIAFQKDGTPELHINQPVLWWPNGYGKPDLYHLKLSFEIDRQTSDVQETNFGIRKVEYSVADSPYLTIVVNGVKVMVRGGDWGLDEAMKRTPRKRLDAQFHMHALANLNMIRNWVGQSTEPDFYEMADKYGILLWDEFFQPNPGDGPNVHDIPTYLANVTDKVIRYRNHPSIVVWCARNEGYPPKELDEQLKALMTKLDPQRLYQSNSADGRGVSSHGPYYWRAPRYFYVLNEAFKTETGSVSVPTIESIQGMLPKKDWETIDDAWAQHDMASGAQRGDEYPTMLAKRYGNIRNLADFVRKAQMANYEAFRAMYEGRNAKMFTETTGILTWMSHPAQPSFVWQLYHYDLDPNASLYAVKKASETVHVQMNESNRALEIVNNLPEPLHNLRLKQTLYRFDGTVDSQQTMPVETVAASSTIKVSTLFPNPHITQLFFLKLELTDSTGKLLSTNLYWQHVAQDEFDGLEKLPTVALEVQATSQTQEDRTLFHVTLHNPSKNVALMAHLQLHDKASGKRILPAFYSDNYLSLVPGEERSINIEAATMDMHGEAAIYVDGFNVTVKPTKSAVTVMLNENAQPMHWPASKLVSAP